MNSSSPNSPQFNSFSNTITICEYCFVTILYSISLALILRILYSLYKRVKRIHFHERNGLSNLLITNLICWAILLASGIPHNLWMIGNWRPMTRFVSADFLFWSTILTQCMMSIIPFSVFFLSLDRTFSIQWIISYGERQKLFLLSGCLLVMAFIFVANFIAYIQILPLPDQTACIVFACLMTNGNNVFISSKLFGGFLIVTSGSYFLQKLRKRRNSIQPSGTTMYGGNQNQRQNKIEVDTLVLMMLATELGLNLIPQLLVLIIQNWIVHASIASYLGPHNLSLNSLEGLITSLIYRHTLRRFIESSSSVGGISNHIPTNNNKRSTAAYVQNGRHPPPQIGQWMPQEERRHSGHQILATNGS